MVIEVRLPIEANKGTALKRVVEQRGLRSALVLGDDLTDLDSFNMLAQLQEETALQGLAIAVLAASTPAELLAAADYALADAEVVEIFLSWLADEAGQG